jgi:hypothetical protein
MTTITLYVVLWECKNGVEFMARRLKYPEASTKASHYSSLVSELTTKLTTISGYIDNARTIESITLDPHNVDGEYYNRYKAKQNKWILIHNQQVAIFDTFITNLDFCITKAKNLESLWQARKGVMEDY